MKCKTNLFTFGVLVLLNAEERNLLRRSLVIKAKGTAKEEATKDPLIIEA
jgi:hypothetical protein